MEIGSGHQWVAQRIPDDSYAVVANQLSIQSVVFNGNDFMYSKNLQNFVYDNKLWPEDAVFNLASESYLHPLIQAGGIPGWLLLKLAGK